MRIFEHPEETYQRQASLRQKYVEERVAKTVERLSRYPQDLLQSFILCGRNGQQGNGAAHLKAHRDWVQYYMTGDNVQFQHKRSGFFQSCGLSDEHDQLPRLYHKETKDDARRILNDRKNAMANMANGIDWKSVELNGRNPADDLGPLRSRVISAVDALYLQFGEGNSLLFPDTGQVGTVSSELRKCLTSIAPNTVAAILRQFDAVRDEMIRPEPKWVTLPDQDLRKCKPMRWRFQGFIPGPDDVYEEDGSSEDDDLKASQPLKALRLKLATAMEKRGYEVGVLTSYGEYKTTFTHGKKKWCILPVRTVVNPILSKNGQMAGIEVLSPFLNSPEDIAPFNAFLEELRKCGFRTNSTTARSHDLLAHNMDPAVLQAMIHQILTSREADIDLLNAVARATDSPALIALSGRMSQYLSFEGLFANKGSGNVNFLRVIDGSGSPNGEAWGKLVLKDLGEISQRVVPVAPKIIVPGGEQKTDEEEVEDPLKGASEVDFKTLIKTAKESLAATPAETGLRKDENSLVCGHLYQLLEFGRRQGEEIQTNWGLFQEEYQDIARAHALDPANTSIADVAKHLTVALELGRDAHAKLRHLLQIAPAALNLLREEVPLVSVTPTTLVETSDVILEEKFHDQDIHLRDGLAAAAQRLAVLTFGPEDPIDVNARVIETLEALQPLEGLLADRRKLTNFNRASTPAPFLGERRGRTIIDLAAARLAPERS